MFDEVFRGNNPAVGCGLATKRERKLLAYLMRSAAKTSPFSTFMHQAVLRVENCFDAGHDSHPDPLDLADRRSRVYPTRSALAAMTLAALADPERRDGDLVVVNPSIRWIDDRTVSLLASKSVVFASRFWRSERLTRGTGCLARSACVFRVLPPTFSWGILRDGLLTAGLARG